MATREGRANCAHLVPDLTTASVRSNLYRSQIGGGTSTATSVSPSTKSTLMRNWSSDRTRSSPRKCLIFAAISDVFNWANGRRPRVWGQFRSSGLPLIAMLAIAASSFVAANTVSAETRVALVIGNDNYDHLPTLRNARNDAIAIGDKLDNLGFEVVFVETDIGRREMFQKLFEFEDELKRADIGLVYYAGHGVQVGGRNYLIPTDARLEREADLKSDLVPLAQIYERILAAGSPVNIVILDACRNNPLPNTLRSLSSRGLASEPPPVAPKIETYIMYAAAQGEVAIDGPEGGNGVFTGELLKALSVPGLTIEDVYKRTREAVREKTSGDQLPYTEGSLEKYVYLNRDGATDRNPPSPIAPTAVNLPISIADSIAQGEPNVYRFEITREKPVTTIFTTGAMDTKGTLVRLDVPGIGVAIAEDDNSGESFNFRIDRYLEPGLYDLILKTDDEPGGEFTIHLHTQSLLRVADTSQLTIQGNIKEAGGVDHYLLRFPEVASVQLGYESGIPISARLMTVSDGKFKEVVSRNGNNFFEDLRPGQYFLVVSSQESGSYEMHVRRYDELVSSLRRTTRGSSGVDYFQFSVEMEAPYVSIYTSGAVKTNFNFSVLNDDGKLDHIYTRDYRLEEVNSQVLERLESRKYFLAVSWRSKRVADEYVIHVDGYENGLAMPFDEHGDSMSRATRLGSKGGIREGRMYRGDEDVFRFRVRRPTQLTRIKVLSEDFSGDIYLDRLHESGELESIESGELGVRALEAGTYFVSVVDFRAEAEAQYRLSVEPVESLPLSVTSEDQEVGFYSRSGKERSVLLVEVINDSDFVEIEDLLVDGKGVWRLVTAGEYLVAAADVADLIVTQHSAFADDDDLLHPRMIDSSSFVSGWLHEEDADYFSFSVRDGAAGALIDVVRLGDYYGHTSGMRTTLIRRLADGEFESIGRRDDSPGTTTSDISSSIGLLTEPGTYYLKVQSDDPTGYRVHLNDIVGPVELRNMVRREGVERSVEYFLFSVNGSRRSVTIASSSSEGSASKLFEIGENGDIRRIGNPESFRRGVVVERVLEEGRYMLGIPISDAGYYSVELRSEEVETGPTTVADDHVDLPLSAAVVLGPRTFGALSAGDVDFFQFQVAEKDRWVRVRVTSGVALVAFLVTNETEAPDSRVVDGFETVAACAVEACEVGISRLLGPGKYYVGIVGIPQRSNIPQRENIGEYTVVLDTEDVPPDRHSDDPANATVLEHGDAFEEGWIGEDDVDYFSFSVLGEVALVTLRVTDESSRVADEWSRWPVRSAPYTFAKLLGGYRAEREGEYVISTVPSILEAYIPKLGLVTKLRTNLGVILPRGTYHVKIETLSSIRTLSSDTGVISDYLEPVPGVTQSNAGMYRVDVGVSDVPLDDHADLPSEATDLGAISEGWIGGEDVDYFRIVVGRGREDLSVYSVSDVQLRCTLLRPTVEADGYDVLAVSRESFDAANCGIRSAVDPGVYFLKVETWEAHVGHYTLHVERETMGTRWSGQ